MKVTIDGYDIVGTPSEVAELIRAHREAAGGRAAPAAPDRDTGLSDDERFASERVAYRALSRRPLSPAQRTLFETLAGASPRWTKASELQRIIEYNANQLGGLLGAIGRRLSQTDGYVKNSALIEWLWDADENEYSYRLPPSVCAAVRRIFP